MAIGSLGKAATRRFIVGLVVFLGVFLLCFGVGSGNPVVAVLGLLVGGLAGATRLRTLVRPRPRQWVLGTGRVVMVADDPPATGEYGRCELQLVVEVPGVRSETVTVRDPRVPVATWPYPGMEVPIEAVADNVRNVRILWSDLAPSTPAPAAWPDDEFDLIPRQPADSHPAPTDDLIDFDIDDDPTFADEPDAPAAPRPRPSPRPREASEPTVVAAPALVEPVGSAATPGPDAEPEPTGSAVGDGPATEDVSGAEGEPAAAARAAKPVVDDLITEYPSAHPAPTAAVHAVGVTLLVSDLARSLAFYRDLLGFYEVDSGEGNVVLASGGTRLVLRASADLGRISRRTVHLNLEVGDIHAVYAELKANGVRFTYPPRVVNRGTRLELWGAAFRDPDGHGIAIAQWRTPTEPERAPTDAEPPADTPQPASSPAT